jgi:DNA (cytosine-5)-methyltransferase 1
VNGVSLFSGAGGFELGFERAGIHTVLQAEQDPWCLEVLARHWPDVERVTDVRQVDARALDRGSRHMAGAGHRADAQPQRLLWRVASGGADLVYGGFPCQDVSVAGNRAGLGGARSGLWSEFARVLRELRPTWLCVENVPGLLSSAGGRDFGTILSDLDDLGYGVAWAVLDARYFGVPQRRRRVFIVGCLGNPDAAAAVLAVCESGCGHPAPSREAGEGIAYSLGASVRGTGDGHGNAWNTTYVAGSDVSPEAMRPLTARSTGYRMDGESENFVVANGLRASDGHHHYSSPCGDGADNLIAFDYLSTGTERSDIVRRGDYSGSLGAQRTHEAISNSAGVRRLTPLECERLQGWPDEHTRWTADGREIPDSHRYRMAGNGVVATVAEWIGHRLVAVDRMMTAI